MCGINLIWDKSGQLSGKEIRRMNAAISHRGPDAEGAHSMSFGGGTLFLGHRRLSMLDPSPRSNQPMLDPDTGAALVFNGEIYNYKALKEKLPERSAYRSGSDTEVLLHLLCQTNGQSMLHDLEGMYAFAFVNPNRGQLLLARDPQGIKPLYYYQDYRYLIVSSELRGILASGLVEERLNTEQIPEVLTFRHAHAPSTLYQGIFELPAGQWMSFEPPMGIQTGKIRTSNLAVEESLDEDQLLTRFDDALRAAVERHLVSDVPLGLFLSGGVDSTLLLAYIRELGHEGFPVFTIANESSEASTGTEDMHFAKVAADLYGADHLALSATHRLLEGFDEFVDQMDQPIADPAAMLTEELARQSRQHVKGVLTGGGADEVFGGYHRHTAFKYYLAMRQKRPWELNMARWAGNQRALGLLLKRSRRRHFQKFAQSLDANPYLTFQQFSSLSMPKALKLRTDAFSNFEDWSDLSRAEALRRMLRQDRERYLVGDVLAVADRHSMRHSLEVRVPYLDGPLLSRVDQHSLDLLRYGRKWITSELLRRKGGQQFVNRPKEGFGMPLGAWLRTKPGAPVRRYLENPGHPLFETVPYKDVSLLLKAHLSGRGEYAHELWAYAVLARWIERF